MRWQFIRETDK